MSREVTGCLLALIDKIVPPTGTENYTELYKAYLSKFDDVTGLFGTFGLLLDDNCDRSRLDIGAISDSLLHEKQELESERLEIDVADVGVDSSSVGGVGTDLVDINSVEIENAGGRDTEVTGLKDGRTFKQRKNARYKLNKRNRRLAKLAEKTSNSVDNCCSKSGDDSLPMDSQVLEKFPSSTCSVGVGRTGDDLRDTVVGYNRAFSEAITGDERLNRAFSMDRDPLCDDWLAFDPRDKTRDTEMKRALINLEFWQNRVERLNNGTYVPPELSDDDSDTDSSSVFSNTSYTSAEVSAMMGSLLKFNSKANKLNRFLVANASGGLLRLDPRSNITRKKKKNGSPRLSFNVV